MQQQAGQRDARRHVQLAVYALDLLADRVVAEAQPLGDLAVGTAVDDEQRHLPLPRGVSAVRVSA